MASLAARLGVAISLLLLLHAGVSAVQYRGLVTAAGLAEEAGSLPLDVYVELLVGFVLCLVCAIPLAGELKPIHTSDSSSRTYEVLNYRKEFQTFDTRAQAFAAVLGKQ